MTSKMVWGKTEYNTLALATEYNTLALDTEYNTLALDRAKYLGGNVKYPGVRQSNMLKSKQTMSDFRGISTEITRSKSFNL